jgi:hypothetical protein
MKNPRDLAEYRSNLYALLASVYIQIPASETLSLHWESARKLLDSLKGERDLLRSRKA